MEKLNSIEIILDFYVKSNKLKTNIIDKKNNQSSADHLFGSITLAVAIDSEFKETNDLAKVYRLLLLDEFSTINPCYDYSLLKNGESFQKEIIEAKRLETKESKLAFKYRLLDKLLTNLIKENQGRIGDATLIKKGAERIALICGKEPSECENIFRFYYLNFKLKDKTRSGWDDRHWNIKTDRRERVSEHVVSTMMLAMVMNGEFEYDIDIDRVLKMLAIHEVGEPIIGDITPFDKITPEQKKALERKAVRIALSHLADKKALNKLWLDFDNNKSKNSSKEAIFAHYCDKIEADLQARLYQDLGLHNSLRKQKHNVVFKDPKAKEMLKNGAKDPFDIWYGWDKSIYDKNLVFREFSMIMEIIKDNNLLKLRRIENIPIIKSENHIKTLTI